MIIIIIVIIIILIIIIITTASNNTRCAPSEAAPVKWRCPHRRLWEGRVVAIPFFKVFRFDILAKRW